MKTLFLMNSAMMPRPGYYVCEKISKESFARIFRDFESQGWQIRSAIGYEQNAKILSRLLGRPIMVSMDVVIPSVGDIMLIMKLPYRTREKGAEFSEDDFEFYVAGYCGYSIDRLMDMDEIFSCYLEEEER